MEGYDIFSSILSREEWSTISGDIASKISKYINDKFDKLITSKALLETDRFNAEQGLAEIRTQYEELQRDHKELKNKYDTCAATSGELETQLTILTNEINKLQGTCNNLETELNEYRQQRNAAIDERDDNLRMLQRRNTEVERLEAEVDLLKKQFEAATKAKCEALAQIDEVESMKLNIEYREKRIEQERVLLNNQVQNLTDALNARTEELLNMRRDNTSRCIQLETKLTEKTQELIVANEQIKSLTELNNNYTTRNEELAQKLLNQRETETKMNESYLHEIDAKTKLSNAYKSMYDESQQHSEELKEAVSELQQLLKNATEQYGDLETKHKESELANEEIIAKKNECIEMLKKELITANELIESNKQDDLQKSIEEFSTSTANPSRLLKPGHTVTEIYAQYVSISEKLADKEKENANLNNYITAIVEEIQEKGPLIKKLREDYNNILEANEELKMSTDGLLIEVQQLREENATCLRRRDEVLRENGRYKKQVADLSRQVCHLLEEVEHSRVGSSSNSPDTDLSDSVSSADVITKKLVTFNDISELQVTNQKLLVLVRQLTERQEEVEALDPAAIAELKSKLDQLKESHNELLEERERQNKMMITLGNQRDMYKNLYNQALKANGEDIPFIPNDTNGDLSKMQTDSSDSQSDDKLHELQSQIDDYKKKIDNMKSENEIYRKEKSINEKMLLEQIDNMRDEIKELTKQSCKLSSQVEYNEEKFKVMQNNIDIYKKQINGLEKQNKIYSETIIKHEQTIIYLKDETLQTQTKLSKAEVMLGDLQKENALLRDAENRLIKERDSMKREVHTQNLIQTNIELIKATLERNDAEAKIRLEDRLQEAHRECAAVRRRLQEEQDRFRQLTEHLEKQTETAKQRMEEEKEQADKLRRELLETRDELMAKSTQIEDLTKKLKGSVLMIPETNTTGHRIIELEQQLGDANAEIEALKSKLKMTKEASEQYFNVAEVAENQMKELEKQIKEYQQQIENQNNQVKELQEKCAELEGELSIHMDDQDMANAGIRSKSHQLQEELNVKVMDLKTAREQLENALAENKALIENLKAVENKYAREVTLHSADLQSLTDLKVKLEESLNELNKIKYARDNAIDTLKENKTSWETQEKILQKEKGELEQRLKDLDAQNSLLLDQINALNNQLSVIQAHTTSDGNQSTSDTSLNKSFVEDDVKSSDQLLKIIKYLRREKDISVSKAEIMEAEYERLKSQFDMISKQLEEMRAAVEAERQKSEISVVTAAKHAEVLRKVETLNAITDSNRSLRLERNNLKTENDDLKMRVEKLEADLAPLQEKNRELEIKAEAMQTENISLRGECNRWRQRAQHLIEKSNRTSPEDWKKLQNERETLAKQLTIERGMTAKLSDELYNVKQEKTKLDEQLRNLKAQSNSQADEVARLKDEVANLSTQVRNLTTNVEQSQEDIKRITEENRVLTEDTAGKDVNITELKNNLTQVRKIAKKYKIQCEEQIKELKTLKEESEAKESELNGSIERQVQEQRTQFETRITEIEQSHKDATEKLNRQMTASTEENENLRKEIENQKQILVEREERFKNLFKIAKDRIMTQSEEINSLKASKANQQEGSSGTTTSSDPQTAETSSNRNELLEKIETLEKEKTTILAEKRQENEKLTSEIEALVQKVNQLQRQLGQQGAKPSTSTGSTEKPATEPPTANIKPMAGHSTNTQTQSVQIHPWRSAGETPLASIRPMSAQLRTVTVLPTSQSPSAVMVPPQQQVHTTGSSSIEALSSSPTSSHTDYVPATSSANPATVGPRQVVVPPTQSSQDAEDEENSSQVQTAPQQQAVALVLPRVEPPSSAPTQEQGTSSSGSSNTVTTTQAGLKRPREAEIEQGEEQSGAGKQQQSKRVRVQQTANVSDSGLEVEYQVPTSSQRDHDDDNVIVLESDEDGCPDEGEGADDEPDDPDTEGYEIEVMEQDNYEDADCQDEEEEEGGNEVEVIEDSSEVPNQSERSVQEGVVEQDIAERAQSEATSSGTDGGNGGGNSNSGGGNSSTGGTSGGVTISQASTSVSMTMPSLTRTRPVAPLPSRQQQSHLLLGHGLEEGGDDGIVPSTPTLFVPTRSDGFGEAVSSPHVPTSGRFTFNDSTGLNTSGTSEVVPEQTLEVANVDDNSTGRSVPSTPLQSSPQEAIGGAEEQHQTNQSDEMPTITVSGVDEDEPTAEASTEEGMGPPNVAAGTSSESSKTVAEACEESEGDDGVSSEGEKPPNQEENEEEGREAEASPSTNTRSKTLRGSNPAMRRPTRQSTGRGLSRSGPTPIVWSDQRSGQQQQQQSQQQQSQRHSDGGRGRMANYAPRPSRRARGRGQRPYGRF